MLSFSLIMPIFYCSFERLFKSLVNSETKVCDFKFLISGRIELFCSPTRIRLFCFSILTVVPIPPLVRIRLNYTRFWERIDLIDFFFTDFSLPYTSWMALTKIMSIRLSRWKLKEFWRSSKSSIGSRDFCMLTLGWSGLGKLGKLKIYLITTSGCNLSTGSLRWILFRSTGDFAMLLSLPNRA